MHTRKSSQKAADALDAGARLKIDDVWYEARVGDVTAPIARELRAATGGGFMKLMASIGEDPDVDNISAFVWVARRIKGEQVALEDVEVTYADLLGEGFEVAEAGAEEVDADDPEA